MANSQIKYSKKIIYIFPDMAERSRQARSSRQTKWLRLSAAEVKRIMRTKGKPATNDKGKQVLAIRAVPIGYTATDIKSGAGIYVWTWKAGKWSNAQLIKEFNSLFDYEEQYHATGVEPRRRSSGYRAYFNLVKALTK